MYTISHERENEKDREEEEIKWEHCEFIKGGSNKHSENFSRSAL